MNELFQSIEKNDIQSLRELLTQKIDVHQRNDKGDTPLMLAAKNGNTEIFRCLLENHAEINAVNNTGASALIFATFYKHSEIIRMLLENNASINIFGALDKGMALMTPLGIAVLDSQFNKNYEIVQMLLQYGADVNFPDAEGRIPLHLAGRNSFLIELLLEKSDINTVNKRNGKTLLMELSADPFCEKEHIKTLLEKGANINLEDNNGETALLKSIKCRMNKTGERYDIPQYLINNGADINYINKHGLSILNIALLEKWSYSAIEFIIHCPINKRIVTKDNQTYLMLLVSLGSIGLLKKFSSIFDWMNHQDNNGNTVLHYAVENSGVSIELLDFLLKNKANVNICNHKSQTPFLYGLIYGLRDMKIIRLFLEAGVDVDIKDENGETALFYAIRENNEELASWLIMQGASWKIENKNGYNAYKIAVSQLSDAENYKDEEGRHELRISSCRKIIEMLHLLGAGKEFEIR